MIDEMFMRNSERTMMYHCRQAWFWAYVEHLIAKQKKMDALLFGDLIHRSLAEFYIPETRRRRRRGPHPAKTFNKLCDALVGTGADGDTLLKISDEEDDKWINARELGTAMLEGYIDLYGKDQRYVIIYPEMPFQYRIKDPLTGKYLVTYVGTSDAFVYDLEYGTYGLLEHKTAAQIKTSHLFIDDQAGSYWAIIPRWLKREGVLREGMTMSFMNYNFMRKQMPDKRPRNEQGAALNQDGTVSKRQQAPLFQRVQVPRGPADRRSAFNRIIIHAREKRMILRGELEIVKSPSKDCSFCAFRDMCDLHEGGHDIEDYKSMVYSTNWDPYAVHVWALQL